MQLKFSVIVFVCSEGKVMTEWGEREREKNTLFFIDQQALSYIAL